MVWVPALPPMLATIGISTASATIFSIDPSNWLITHDASSAVSRLANSQGKRPLAMVQTESDSSSSPPDAAERLDVLLGLLLDHVDDVVEGDDADQPLVVDRPPARRPGRSARTAAPPPPGRRSPARGRSSSSINSAIGTGRLVRSRRSSATAPLSRRSGIDHVELPEALGQVGRLAHVVDGLADGPSGPDRDELGLHAPAGRVLRIVEAARERDRARSAGSWSRISACSSFGRSSRMATASSESSSRTPFGDGLGRQLLEDFLADRVVDLGQRGEVEVVPHQLDQARAQLRIERLDQIADIGLDADRRPARAARARRRRRSPARPARHSPRAPPHPRRATRWEPMSRSCLFRRACRALSTRWDGYLGLYAGFWGGNRQRRRCMRLL